MTLGRITICPRVNHQCWLLAAEQNSVSACMGGGGGRGTDTNSSRHESERIGHV